MTMLIRRMVVSIFLLMLVAWVLLKLLPPAMPFLVALWVLSIFGASVFAKKNH